MSSVSANDINEANDGQDVEEDLNGQKFEEAKPRLDGLLQRMWTHARSPKTTLRCG